MPRHAGFTRAPAVLALACSCAATAVLVAGSAADARQALSGAVGHAATTHRLSADPGGDLRFTRTRITASKGSITLRLSNPSPLSHGIAIGNRSGRIVSQGGTSRVTVNLKAGSYTYFCPVSGHRAAGMTGRLVVR